MSKLRKWLIYELLVKPEIWVLIKKLQKGEKLDHGEHDYVNVLAMFERKYLGRDK